MKGLHALPKSILHNIVSHLSPGLADLRNCSSVCRALGEASTTALYNHIDLSIDERYDPDADAKSKRRQLRLVRSISEYISSSDIYLFRLMIISRNPKLGALVRIFKNYHNPFGDFQDATLDPDSSMLIGAAQNMKNLSRASLTPNQLAAYIIATVQSYPQLVELTVYGLKPEEHIWSMTPTSLTTLKWEVPPGWNSSEQNPWDTAGFLVNVVEATCPSLEWLDISVCQMRTSLPKLPVVSPDRVQQYRGAQATPAPKLAHLRHFGFRYQYDGGHRREIQVAFLDFIRRHRQSLKSVTIPVGYRPWTKEELDFILQVCRQLPDLKDLTLEATRTGQTGENMTGYEFFHALTTNIASPHFSIERFSVTNIDVPFSPAIGKLFRPWTSLKFLRLGDGDNNNGPYRDDGRLDFNAYKPVSTHHFKYE